MMRFLTLVVLLMLVVHASGQDTAFFPSFSPYAPHPILNYGDGLSGSPWNDPTVLKEGNQYYMYTSGVMGGINHPNDDVSIYRWVSSDGYSWSLNPATPVLQPAAGSYFSGGVETPSVVFYKGEYHMYNTVYVNNSPFDFRISHATSPDGINWQMDANFILAPTPGIAWMSTITAEPGVLVKEDTLYLFFAAGDPAGFLNIGLVRSVDGASFLDTTLTATLPTGVYPLSENYAGLSTPSPVLLGDTIYLFTDVAQTVFGNNWMQVALHQFKSYGDLNKWYHDDVPIHRRDDFSWTNGNFNAEIRSITPLVDGNKLRIWYAGHKISEIDTSTNDTTNYVYFIGNELHVDSGFWGIGTSEYDLTVVGVNLSNAARPEGVAVQFQHNAFQIEIASTSHAQVEMYTLDGKLIFRRDFVSSINGQVDYRGIVLVKVTTGEEVYTAKYFVD
ncbi:MAG: hypothetical protein ACFB10_18925 [Salibacteraceae bacterium]